MCALKQSMRKKWAMITDCGILVENVERDAVLYVVRVLERALREDAEAAVLRHLVVRDGRAGDVAVSARLDVARVAV